MFFWYSCISRFWTKNHLFGISDFVSTQVKIFSASYLSCTCAPNVITTQLVLANNDQDQDVQILCHQYGLVKLN